MTKEENFLRLSVLFHLSEMFHQLVLSIARFILVLIIFLQEAAISFADFLEDSQRGIITVLVEDFGFEIVESPEDF